MTRCTVRCTSDNKCGFSTRIVASGSSRISAFTQESCWPGILSCCASRDRWGQAKLGQHRQSIKVADDGMNTPVVNLDEFASWLCHFPSSLRNAGERACMGSATDPAPYPYVVGNSIESYGLKLEIWEANEKSRPMLPQVARHGWLGRSWVGVCSIRSKETDAGLQVVSAPGIDVGFKQLVEFPLADSPYCLRIVKRLH